MEIFLNGKCIDLFLSENGKLKYSGLDQYSGTEKNQILKYLKTSKPELIEKIKAGIESVPVPEVEKMDNCIDSKPCEYLGITQDGYSTRATCLYNQEFIWEPEFYCPLAKERFKKQFGIETGTERFNRLYGKYQNKNNVA
ncbi:MAG: hypothetical protein ACQETL_19275 [Bacteroidota bacterium]